MRKLLSISAGIVAVLAMAAPMTQAGSISFAAMSETSPATQPAIEQVSPNAAQFDAIELVPLSRDASILSEVAVFEKSPAPQSVNLTPIGIMMASSAVTVVPEPGTWVLLGLGFLGLLAARKRRRA